MASPLTPLKAIRKKCLECSACSPKEVGACNMMDCPLCLFRFGKNPHRTGLGSMNNLPRPRKLGSQGASRLPPNE
jgi:hypothetical protein